MGLQEGRTERDASARDAKIMLIILVLVVMGSIAVVFVLSYITYGGADGSYDYFVWAKSDALSQIDMDNDVYNRLMYEEEVSRTRLSWYWFYYTVAVTAILGLYMIIRKDKRRK